MSILTVFGAIGRWAKRAFGYAQSAGLTDQLVQQALALVREAAKQFADNTVKREWVVSALVAAGIKENVARIAVELAVSLFKAEK